jgi:hypothetical protein
LDVKNARFGIGSATEGRLASLTMTCLLAAATAYQLPVPALQAIQAVEGGRTGQEVCGNFDGSCDLGPFQVNDHAWVATLAARLGADQRLVRDTLRDDGCWNVQVASWILRQELDASAGDLETAIGNYHSHLPGEHMAYRRKVDAVLYRMQSGAAPPPLPGDVHTLGPVAPPTMPGDAAFALATEPPMGRLVFTSAAPAHSASSRGAAVRVFRGTTN